MDKDLKLSPCMEDVENKKWKWDEEKLLNTESEECLAYNKVTGKFYFESCSDEDFKDVCIAMISRFLFFLHSSVYQGWAFRNGDRDSMYFPENRFICH